MYSCGGFADGLNVCVLNFRMKHGIMVAGRWYEFLAYSQSSLREGTVWFVTAFQFDGRQINAESIRQSLGDFR
jgi:RNA-dependent RNA polymerase